MRFHLPILTIFFTALTIFVTSTVEASCFRRESAEQIVTEWKTTPEQACKPSVFLGRIARDAQITSGQVQAGQRHLPTPVIVTEDFLNPLNEVGKEVTVLIPWTSIGAFGGPEANLFITCDFEHEGVNYKNLVQVCTNVGKPEGRERTQADIAWLRSQPK